jgi:CheY-like chemotaxis protein
MEVAMSNQFAALSRSRPQWPLTIVIVESDESLLVEWTHALAVTRRYIVKTASNGFSGLLRIVEEMPDLIVSNLSLPHLSGAEMIRILRQDPQYRSVAIVVLTEGNNMPPDADCAETRRCMRISKPVTGPELVSALDEVVRVSHPDMEEHN